MSKTKDKILVTGCAGFIGMHLCHSLLNDGYSVLGIDNLNNYYSLKLKKARLNELLHNCIECSDSSLDPPECVCKIK